MDRRSGHIPQEQRSSVPIWETAGQVWGVGPRSSPGAVSSPAPATGDAELVTAALAGDREAFAAIYDRYADRLHDFCHSLLRDREEAADATQDAFVTAAERLGQLRDPERLRSWLYAVARSQALARMRARRRTATGSEVSEVPDAASGQADLAEQTELRELVWSAATGLSEQDRSLLDLHLRHGLEGAELGEAMGVGASHAYVLLSRLRDEVERSLGTLLAARLGRDDCVELNRLLAGWDGRFSPLIRKRVARHVDGCDLCAERRRTVASPLSLLAAVPLVPAPVELRARVLDRVELTGSSGPSSGGGRGGPSAPGGPGGGRRLPRGWALVGVAALLALASGGVLLARGGAAGPQASATTAAAAGGAPGAPGTTGGLGATGTSGPPGASSSTAAPATSAAAGPASSAAGATQGGAGAPTTGGAATTTTAVPAPGALGVTPTALNLGSEQDSATLLLRNSGGAGLTWSVTTSSAWLRASPTQGSLAAGGQTRVTVTADRSGLAEGEFSGTVRLAWAGGSTQVGVQLAVERAPRISRLAATPLEIFVKDCQGVPTTASVQAAVDDESGLAAVTLEWGDGPTRAAMTERSGLWFGRLGPVSKPGTVSWRVVATDTRGNTASAAGTPVVATTCTIE